MVDRISCCSDQTDWVWLCTLPEHALLPPHVHMPKHSYLKETKLIIILTSPEVAISDVCTVQGNKHEQIDDDIRS